MSQLVLLLCLVLGSSALAMPNIGDYARYKLAFSIDNVLYSAFIKDEIVSMNLGYYGLEATIIYPDGKESVRTTYVPKVEWVTKTVAENYVRDCLATGGQLDKVPTNEWGDIPACMRDESTPEYVQTTWYGNVPFGVVKAYQVFPNGDFAMQTLRAYHLDK